MGIKNKDDFKKYEDLYLRDVRNVVNYFNKKYALKIDLDEVLKRLEEN